MTKKTSIEDIKGIVKCEPTNSVEEVRKLRGKNKKTNRFIVDDAGTLIDMVTRETYDYVSDICPVLNQQNNDNETLMQRNTELGERLTMKEKQIADIKRTIKQLMETERTHLGYNALKQAYNAIME